MSTRHPLAVNTENCNGSVLRVLGALQDQGAQAHHPLKLGMRLLNLSTVFKTTEMNLLQFLLLDFF